ncbi:toluene-4-monooxygenase system B family protein [Amycolatopsis sp. NPDC005232]|uniref:toluene-4-monooxygenase system B family protein n=1 Tax=Amycolatopsis sp. NPDC005232 TaxID=3157027 RepID=UPI0033A3B6FB
MGSPMPVVAHFRGDFLYNLVLIEDTDTIEQVARACAAHSVGRRVAELDRALRVEHAGRFLEPTRSAAEEGVQPMDEVFVSYADS